MKIGLLPLYIKLYDDINVDCTYLKSVYDEIVKMFEDKGIEVETADFCCIKSEFDAAVSKFEEAKADALVTWHAAYSPSLESIEALTKTKLPIIVLDATPTLEFTPAQDPAAIMWNHGIHGVMDMCSMLKRYGKPYAIAAGHYKESDVIDRVCGFARAAVAARKLGQMKVALFGGGFDGMGDFAVPPEELSERFGIKVYNIKPEEIGRINVTKEEIDAEIKFDRGNYTFSDSVIESEYEEYQKSCLKLRRFINENGYNAFSVNFLNVEGVGTMPFPECCKAMERGIGYAGEGDALTAAFTGALLSAYPETSFVEIFCPDWKNNTIFLSHMGEMNYKIAATKPLIVRTNSKYIEGAMPYAGYARMKGGHGVYVNVSRGKNDYRLVLSETEMLDVKEDNFESSMRGWMKPQNMTTAEFLEALSRNGATHHSSFVYGAKAEEIEYFGKLLGMETIVIK